MTPSPRCAWLWAEVKRPQTGPTLEGQPAGGQRDLLGTPPGTRTPNPLIRVGMWRRPLSVCGSGAVVRSLMPSSRLSITAALGRGVVAGVAGTAVMTAFQKLVEMPLTGRPDSYAPASFAEKVLPIDPPTGPGRKQLNYGTHFALGTLWGSAHAMAARAGLRGLRATGVAFGVVYSGDVLLNTALGLYQPLTWSRKDWAIDVVDKLVQAAATGIVYDRVLAPR